VTLAGATAVLVIGHVAHVVQTVLNAPMASVEDQQLCGTRFGAALAANQIDALEGRLVFSDVEDLALHAGNLGRVGKRQIPVELITDPDTPGFHAPMRLVSRDVPRGESLQVEVFDVGFEGGLIVFDREQVVRPLILDQITCGLCLGMQGVCGDHAPVNNRPTRLESVEALS